MIQSNFWASAGASKEECDHHRAIQWIILLRNVIIIGLYNQSFCNGCALTWHPCVAFVYVNSWVRAVSQSLALGFRPLRKYARFIQNKLCSQVRWSHIVIDGTWTPIWKFDQHDFSWTFVGLKVVSADMWLGLAGMMHTMDHDEINAQLAHLLDSEGLDIQLSYDGMQIAIDL